MVWPWLRWPNPSVATTTTFISSTPGGHGPLHAAPVEHQADVGDAVGRRERGEHRLGVGHLRHAGGVDEAGHLDPAGPGGDRPVDELDLVLGREHGLLVLQPVARRHLDDLHRDKPAHDERSLAR